MAEEKEDQKLSRRERRRAEKAREQERDDESEERDAEESEAEARDSAAGDDDEDAETRDEDEDGERPAAAEEKPARDRKLSKSEKKRAKEAEKSATAEIRDRNKRLREQAAEKRRGKREKGRAAPARGLDAGEMVDDALARGTHATVGFLRRYFNVIQWVIVLAIVGGLGWQIYSWRSGKTNAKASDQLMLGADAELGRVGTPPADPDEAAMESRPSFATDEARLEAAAKAYDQAEKERAGSGTAILAALGKAGVLYDQGKFDEAKTKYEQVKASPLAQHDADVRLRALEGIALSLEAKGDVDGALKLFQELEKSEEIGFSALAHYHLARVAFGKGEKDKAKELLTKLNDKLAKDRSPYQTGSYLEKASRDLLGMIDPSAAPPPSSYTPEQLEALKGQIMKDPTKLKKMLEDMGKMRAPDLPVPMEDPGGGEVPMPTPDPGATPTGDPSTPEPGTPGAPPQ